MNRCEFCGNLLGEDKRFRKSKRNKRFCNHSCNVKYNAKKDYYEKYRNSPKHLEKQKRIIRTWYKNNEKRQKNNVLKNYHKNKDKWRERKYTHIHRKEILEFLPKNCVNCGKEDIKIIHHKTYDVPKRKYGNTGGVKEHKDYLKEYIVKYLLGFCSKECHRNYEKSLHH
jgi:hypothetical protein